MERSRGGITAGVSMWTSAPVHSSPSSPEGSTFSWGQAPDDQFLSQMDENGIIGLEESQGQMEGEPEENVEDLLTSEPERGPPVLEEMSCHLSQLLDSLSQATEDDCLSPASGGQEADDLLEDWTDEEDGSEKPRVGVWSLTDCEAEERFGPEDAARRPFPVTVDVSSLLDRMGSLDFSHSDAESPGDFHGSGIPGQSHSEEVKGGEEQFLSVLLKSSTNTSDPSPALINDCGIEAELDLHGARLRSDSGGQSSRLEAYQAEQMSRSPLSSDSSSALKVPFEKATLQDLSDEKLERWLDRSPVKDHQLPSPALITSKSSSSPHKSHGATKTSLSDPEDIRKGRLHRPPPDFSKVEAKVRFPRSGYRPPKRGEDAGGPPSPVVFKSPAEMVREVLLSSAEGCEVVPEEIICPQQASALVQQLQEDYNRLLTKYAEAENTIDRLRLEAKVNFYSDPPRPSRALQSGVVQAGSKVMTLSFPQAQKAEFSVDPSHQTLQNTGMMSKAADCSSSPGSVSSMRSGAFSSDRLMETLCRQTHRFQMQVDAFEDLLKNKKMMPCEIEKGLLTLAEGQESLERAYLDSRGRVQGQAGHVTFDPDRELEGLIFQSGMRLDELREWLEQAHPLTPPPPSDVLLVSMLDDQPQPESSVSPERPVVFVGEERDEDRTTVDILPSLLHPFQEKSQRVERDFSDLMACYQSVKELPKILDRASSGLPGSDAPSPGTETEPREKPSTIREAAVTKTSQSQTSAARAPLTGPSDRSQMCEAHQQSHTCPGPADRKWEQSNSVSSLAESENHGLKANPKSIRAPLLDGEASPETDSGFMGSDSGQLNPAVLSPVHQREVVRPTHPHLKTTANTDSPPLSGKHFTVSPSSLDPPAEPSRAFACSSSPVKQGERRWICSSPSGSTVQWSDISSRPTPSSTTGQTQQARPTPSFLRREAPHRSPSPRDHLKSQSGVQLTHHHSRQALQSLQEEVNRLKEKLEGSLRRPEAVSPIGASQGEHGGPAWTSTPHRFRERVRWQTRQENERGNRVFLRPRSTSVPHRRWESDPASDSEHAQSEPRPSTPRPFPRSSSTSRRGRRTRTGSHRADAMTQPSSASSRSDDSDGARRRRKPGSACQLCSSPSARPGRSRSIPRTFCAHCPVCGAVQAAQSSASKPANRGSVWTPEATRPMSSDRGRGLQMAPPPVGMAPPPAMLGSVHLVPCVPVYPSTLFYSSPVTARPTSVELGVCEGLSLNRSLDRAIATARSIKVVSQNMARSLASGRHNSRTTSC